MTGLEDKAQQDRPVIRAEDAAGAYRLDDAEELESAENINGPDAFPQFGDFLDVTEIGMDGSMHDPVWLECPAGLARAVLDAGLDDGDLFVVDRPEKDDRGNWVFAVTAAGDHDGLDLDDD